VKKALVLVVAVAVTGWVLAITRTGTDARAAGSVDVVLSPGDVVRVESGRFGCRVTRLSGHGRRLFLDCRRAGGLPGTYGVYFGAREVVVVRFVTPRKAKTVLCARHRGEVVRCR
jgi:hypothetical protein